MKMRFSCVLSVEKRGKIIVFLNIIGIILFEASLLLASQNLYTNKPAPTQELFKRGENIYKKQCMLCHGQAGRADGKAEYLLYPKPRNFVEDKFRLVSTSNLKATDEDIFKVITRGMTGSAMPSWEHLSEEDRWGLVYYVRYLSEIENYKKSGEITLEMINKGLPWDLIKKIIHKEIDPQNIIQLSSEPQVTPEALKQGKELFLASCAGCHGKEGKGDGQQEMKDNLGYPLRPRDLTAGIFKGNSSSDELYLRMMAGIPGSPMPSYNGVFTQQQIWDLIHFVQTLATPETEERARLKQSQVTAKRIIEDIEMNPFGRQWSEIDSTFIALTPLWWQDDRIEGVNVKVVYNENQIAFYLTWDDTQNDDNNVQIQSFSDGAALQFSMEKDPPFFGMGDVNQPVYIWHWKSAWEIKEDTRRDIEDQYPNAAIDWYASQKNYKHGSPFEVGESKTIFHDPNFTTGWGAGNPLSDPHKKEAAEEGVSEGFGSFTTQTSKIEKVQAQGTWQGGKWHVIFVRPLKSNEDNLQFEPGKMVSLAFAVWDGSQKNRNGQKAVSIWNQLMLEQ